MALVFGGQSTRGLLYLHARIPPHMVKSIGRRIAVLEFAWVLLNHFHFHFHLVGHHQIEVWPCCSSHIEFWGREQPLCFEQAYSRRKQTLLPRLHCQNHQSVVIIFRLFSNEEGKDSQMHVRRSAAEHQQGSSRYGRGEQRQQQSGSEEAKQRHNMRRVQLPAWQDDGIRGLQQSEIGGPYSYRPKGCHQDYKQA